MIRTVTFDSFPLPLSAVCLGTSRFGTENCGEEKSFGLLDRYYAMGGRFLDTANVYGRWSPGGRNRSELTVGRWLKSRGITDMIVASKCCHYAPEAHDVSRVNRASAEADLEQSRRSLGLDVIPLYYTHRDDPETDIRVIVDFLCDMVNSGKIIRFGLSNYKVDRVRGALDYLGKDGPSYLAGISNERSLHAECLTADAGGEREAPDGMVTTGKALRKLHREENLPLFAFAAAGGGFYAKLADGRIPPEKAGLSDRRVSAELAGICAEHGVSPFVPSVAWVLNSGLPSIPIVGVSEGKQLEEFEAISAWKEDLSGLGPLR